MKRTTQHKKLNFNKKVILLLNEQQKRSIIAGTDTSRASECVTTIPRTTVPRTCPSVNACTTAPTDTCTTG
jgi:hypothetical protein